MPNYELGSSTMDLTVDLEYELRQYVEAALWSSSIGEDFAAHWKAKTGEDFPADVSLESFGFTYDDVAPEALDAMRTDLRNFLEGCEPAALDFWRAELGAGRIGHDFWLTRNRHGAGFWDRFTGGIGERFGRHLTEQATPYGGSDAYVCDDERVYVS